MRMVLLGDVMLGRLVNQRLKTAAPGFPWGDTLPVLDQADIRFANLECVLADSGTPQPGKVFHFRSDTRNVAVLTAAGINAVSLANNHVLDYGAEALSETLPVLDSNGILHAGAGPDQDYARRPAVRRVGQTAVGFIAFTDNQPDWEAGPQRPGVHYVPADDSARHDPRVRDLLALVSRTKARVDLLVVSAHWGGNWGAEVPPGHRRLGKALVDAGSDLVFGHSAHIFRGVEIHRGRPIIYSAGDFIDDYAVDAEERNDQSFIFCVEFSGGVPVRLRLHPTVITGFQARLAGKSAQRIATRMQGLCARLGTQSEWSADTGVLEIPVGS
ncbi:CapA family protein [Arthrobacter oryzae]|uniref:CapA family protein n=1 Tax=Arthrobacter oryzae TaxID=409290 RepID=UPI002864ECB8|nr:CapA family protein [Arthrobacter oryzae]MDR6507919.1 poly-gamma-glutamate synthesis protein (capsule biosynthesis protein) [Arthrobacter oryzae]